MVAGKLIANAKSISLKFKVPGIKILCRNRELPKPAVPVTVPLALAMLPAISGKEIFWVALMVNAAAPPPDALKVSDWPF